MGGLGPFRPHQRRQQLWSEGRGRAPLLWPSQGTPGLFTVTSQTSPQNKLWRKSADANRPGGVALKSQEAGGRALGATVGPPWPGKSVLVLGRSTGGPQICPRNPELQLLGGQGEGWPGALRSPCHTLFLFSQYAAGLCVSDPSRTGCRWPVCPRPRPVPLAFGEPDPALPTPSCLLQESCLLGSAGLGLYFTDGETDHRVEG